MIQKKKTKEASGELKNMQDILEICKKMSMDTWNTDKQFIYIRFFNHCTPLGI